MVTKLEQMSSTQRAAALLVALGRDVSSEILKNMSETEIEKLTFEIANLKDIPADVERSVLEEAAQIFMARQYISQGGIDYARDVLEKALGRTKAKEILSRFEGSLRTTGFNLLKNIDPRQLINFIQNEHPQTISLVLTQLPAQQAAAVLSELSPELQAEVALRIATMEKISPEVVSEIETVLESQLETTETKGLSTLGGTKTVAEILNLVDLSAEKDILQALETENPELAAEIKNLMFVFEDIILLDDRAIQRVLKEIETRELTIALKATSEEVRKKILSNVSERVAAMIKEEVEFMGPMRLTDVEASQQRIVEAIRRLEEEGQIVVAGRGGKEEIVV